MLGLFIETPCIRQPSGMAMPEIHQIKEELMEKESSSSGDVSFDSHDDSSRGSWFTEKDLLKLQTCPPQALFDSEEEEDNQDDQTLCEEVRNTGCPMSLSQYTSKVDYFSNSKKNTDDSSYLESMLPGNPSESERKLDTEKPL